MSDEQERQERQERQEEAQGGEESGATAPPLSRPVHGPPVLASATVASLLAHLPKDHFLKAYLSYASRISTAPPGAHLLAGLSTLAIATPRGTGIGHNGRILPSTLWTGTVTASPAASDAVRLQLDLLKAAVPRGQTNPVLGLRPESIEALYHSLTDCPVQLLAMPESSVFLRRTQEGQRLAGLRDTVAGLWEGDEMGCRTAHEVYPVDRPHLVVSASLSADDLQRYCGPADWTWTGLLARILLAHPEPRTTSATVPPESLEPAREKLTTRLDSLAGFASRDPASFPPGRECSGLSDDGQEAWDEALLPLLANARAASLSDGNGISIGVVDNAEGIALRLALALQYGAFRYSPEGPWSIFAPAVLAAAPLLKHHLDLAAWFATRAPQSKQDATATRVVDFLLHHGAQTSAAIHRHLRLGLRASQEVIRYLVEIEAVCEVQVGEDTLLWPLHPAAPPRPPDESPFT